MRTRCSRPASVPAVTPRWPDPAVTYIESVIPSARRLWIELRFARRLERTRLPRADDRHAVRRVQKQRGKAQNHRERIVGESDLGPAVGAQIVELVRPARVR